MQPGSLYFLTDQYYIDFPDKALMRSHSKTASGAHGRPFFCCLPDSKNPNIFWMIPISGQAPKYKSIYQRKLTRYRTCDTLAFGRVLGREAAFLIQNVCPVTIKYIDKEYTINGASIPVPKAMMSELKQKLRRALQAYKFRGKNEIYPAIDKIKNELLSQLEKEKS